jgi:hypothetical protein
MRPVTVLSVGYPLAPVGPDAVGGSEQVLSALDHALVQSGHRSIVIACQGSQTAGTLVPIPAPPADHTIQPEDHEARRLAIANRIRQVLATTEVDLVHLHGLDFYKYLPPPGVPVLATLHLPPDWYPPEALNPARPGTWLNGVSDSQHAAIPPSSRLLPPIRNGVPTTRLGALRPKTCRYALMLSRICPEKGIHLALEAAHTANMPLLIAGEIFPYQAHQDYFSDQIRPLLDRDRRYLGPVGFARKRRLLAAARALLIPSLVAETSSLVAMEAASAGTPVIAFNTGALPETIEHGRTGFIVDTPAQMAEALTRLDAIDRDTCRATARRRFSHDRMTAEYLARYALLTHQAQAAA